MRGRKEIEIAEKEMPGLMLTIDGLEELVNLEELDITNTLITSIGTICLKNWHEKLDSGFRRNDEPYNSSGVSHCGSQVFGAHRMI